MSALVADIIPTNLDNSLHQNDVRIFSSQLPLNGMQSGLHFLHRHTDAKLTCHQIKSLFNSWNKKLSAFRTTLKEYKNCSMEDILEFSLLQLANKGHTEAGR